MLGSNSLPSGSVVVEVVVVVVVGGSCCDRTAHRKYERPNKSAFVATRYGM